MAENDGATAGKAGGGKKKKIIAAAAALVLFATGGFVGTKLLNPAEAAAADEPVAEATVEEGAVVEVATMTASLGQGHLARVGFAVVQSTDAVQEVVAGRFPLLKDAAIDEIASSDPAQLATPEGVDDLRARLTTRAAGLYPDGDVLRVVLTELVVQ